jgi:hypothetical protein
MYPLHFCKTRWEQFILNYKLMELTKNFLITSGTSSDSTIFNNTTFSLLKTGDTVPLIWVLADFSTSFVTAIEAF